ncbi:MAG: hypothetical protein K2R98_15160 [Gemmataceae bacterium]|nr:hypothetical protein [Gemmataceae bacterium]
MFTGMWQLGRWGTGSLALLGSLVLTGCSHTGGGCGGGCCGGKGASAGPAVARTAPVEASGHAHAAAPADLPAAAPGRPYGGQKTCPVMDEPLGSMGPAIPVAVNGDTVYVCCKGCAAKVQRDPDKYLPKVLAERAAAP